MWRVFGDIQRSTDGEEDLGLRPLAVRDGVALGFDEFGEVDEPCLETIVFIRMDVVAFCLGNLCSKAGGVLAGGRGHPDDLDRM